MNRRNNMLLDHVTNALIQGGDKHRPPKNVRGFTVFNPAKNLKRKLKREWNKKPWNVCHAQRLGIIRTLVVIHEGAPTP